jgi:hypothetical protein
MSDRRSGAISTKSSRPAHSRNSGLAWRLLVAMHASGFSPCGPRAIGRLVDADTADLAIPTRHERRALTATPECRRSARQPSLEPTMKAITRSSGRDVASSGAGRHRADEWIHAVAIAACRAREQATEPALHRHFGHRCRSRAPSFPRIPRLSPLARRCPCDNEGRSASAVASRPERGSSTPIRVTPACWPLRTRSGDVVGWLGVVALRSQQKRVTASSQECPVRSAAAERSASSRTFAERGAASATPHAASAS